MDARSGILYDAVRKSSSPQQVADLLRAQGFSHLLVRVDLLQEYADGVLDQETRQRLRDFFQREARQIRSESGYVLLSLGARG